METATEKQCNPVCQLGPMEEIEMGLPILKTFGLTRDGKADVGLKCI